jgi:hypothetical protein
MSVDGNNIESKIDEDTISLDNNSIDSSKDDKSMDISVSSGSSFSSTDEKKAIEAVMQSTEALCHAASLFLEERLFEEEQNKVGGSKPGKAPNKDRDFAMAHDRLVQDYFSGENSIYNEVDFERRFRVSRPVFNRIYDAILYKGKFSHKKDATGKLGIHPLVRTVACFRYLAYGNSFDSCDEYLRLSDTSCLVSVKEFCSLVVQKFGSFYLNRTPSKEERDHILNFNKSRGFPGMFASWDCSHFKWDKCPIELHGGFKSRYANMKTVVLECVVDCNLWIWFMNFGNAGSLNDLNILAKSNIVSSIWDGSFDIRCQPYEVNGTVRDYMYFLVDGIYPRWSIFINTFKNPTTDDEKKFSRQQEGCRKDVERVFAVCGYHPKI